jgi:cell division septation protein DedD
VGHQIQDEGFHEIQLNGKQLVFLFMAATVVSVVIFLCGVLVGRGVRAERSVADITPIASPTDPAPQPAPANPPPPAPGSDPTTAAAPPPAADDLSYFKRLEKPNAQPEQLKAESNGRAPAADKTAPASSPAPAAAPKPTRPEPVRPEPARAEPARPAAPDASSPEPSGSGFAVQIAALNVRSEADAIAKRLSSKGYAAYVITPPSGTPAVYRVRVGKFPTRREAETVAARLQKEEQFKPWVTR